MGGRLTNKKRFTKRNIEQVPNQSGVYVLWRGKTGNPYIGKAGAGNLQKRINRHFNQKDKRGITSFQYRPTTSDREARNLEKKCRNKLNPKQRI